MTGSGYPAVPLNTEQHANGLAVTEPPLRNRQPRNSSLSFLRFSDTVNTARRLRG